MAGKLPPSRLGLLLIGAAILVLIGSQVGPTIVGVATRARREQEIGAARHLYIVMQSAALDRAAEIAAGDAKKPLAMGWPMESGETSRRAYLDRLVREDYLSAADRRAMDDFVIVNVAEDDPGDTALVLRRADYARFLQGKKEVFPWVFLKGGACLRDAKVQLPPRIPPILSMDE
jgi:hypothetical protein